MNKYLVLCMMFFAAPVAIGQEREIQRLEWLIGVWQFDDRQVAGEYRETGDRVCEYALNDRYIMCESIGVTHKNKERKYIWYFNFNPLDDRYEIVGVNSDYPKKLLYIAKLSEDGHTLELENFAWGDDGLVLLNLASIKYNGSDQYIWEIHSTNRSTGEVTVFQDTVTRVSQQ